MIRSVFIHPAPADADAIRFAESCRFICVHRGWGEAPTPFDATLALAPCLRRVLPVEEYSAPALGTLIFHPSALPYRRGRDAIRHTVRAGERVSGATWFWCGGEHGLDSGPICEQELVVLHPGETPRMAYAHRFIPAGLRALERALDGISAGNPRRVDQNEELATFDPACNRMERAGWQEPR